MILKRILTVLFFIINFSFVVNSQSAIEYNDELTKLYFELDDEIVNFVVVLRSSVNSVEDLNIAYYKTYTAYYKNYYSVKYTIPLKDDPGYLNAIVAFYDAVKNALDVDYKQIIDMYNSDDWQDNYWDLIDDIDENTLQKLIEKENNVVSTQQKFADTFGLKID